jgi:hypothetical protein
MIHVYDLAVLVVQREAGHGFAEFPVSAFAPHKRLLLQLARGGGDDGIFCAIENANAFEEEVAIFFINHYGRDPLAFLKGREIGLADFEFHCHRRHVIRDFFMVNHEDPLVGGHTDDLTANIEALADCGLHRWLRCDFGDGLLARAASERSCDQRSSEIAQTVTVSLGAMPRAKVKQR